MDPETDSLLLLENISLLGLFLSHVPTISRFPRKKSTEKFHPFNFLAGSIFCLVVLVNPDPTLDPIRIICLIGVVLYFRYLIAFIDNTTINWKIIINLSTAAFAYAMWYFYKYVEVDQEKIKPVVLLVQSIILYSSPLTVVSNVFKTKSVEFLPFWVSFAGFVNACVWTSYALKHVDDVLLVGHGLGAVLSAFQLVLHVVYGHPLDNFLEPLKKVSKCISQLTKPNI